MFRYLALCAAVGAASAAVGCRSRAIVPAGSSAVRLAAADADGRTALWDAVQDSLREYRFRIDRVDAREGVVTTLPETSKQYFEFWRRDAATPRDVLESTINPIRRWVEVRVDGLSDPSEQTVSITVHKERLSSPDRQFNNSTAAYRFFGDALPSTTGIVRVTPEYDRWYSIGRDPALETRLLDLMVRRSGASLLGYEPLNGEEKDATTVSTPPAAAPAEREPAPRVVPTRSGEPEGAVPVPTQPPTPPPSIPSAPPDDSSLHVPLRDVEEPPPSSGASGSPARRE